MTHSSETVAVTDKGSLEGGTLPHISGPKLARNTTLNLVGQVLPLLAGIVLIPYIVRGLGPDRFGLLGIVWVVFGYFSLMDFGLGRATTKFIAEWIPKGEANRISDMVWSSVVLQLLFGIAGGILLALITPTLVERILKTPAPLVGEGRAAFYALAVTLPLVLVANGFRSILEGCQRFDLTNLIRIPSNILGFAIPAIAVATGLKLPEIVLWMGISRLGFACLNGFYCLRVLPCLRVRPVLRRNVILPLLSFGSWVTAANVINPVLVSMDRFLIGSLISTAMVGYYTAPFEAVTKLWLVPASLMTTVYPACSALGTERFSNLQDLYSRSIKYIFCSLAPISLLLVVFARQIIGVWLGPEYVDKSAVPLQLLAVGVFINCFAHVPYCFLQALGRPDTTAKLALCELIPYGILSWSMIHHYGVDGAAAAWSVRVLVEVLLLLWIAWRTLSLSALRVADRSMWTALAALFAAGLAICGTHRFLANFLFLDVVLCTLWVTGFSFVVWKWVLDERDRASALAVMSPVRRLMAKSFRLAVEG